MKLNIPSIRKRWITVAQVFIGIAIIGLSSASLACKGCSVTCTNTNNEQYSCAQSGDKCKGYTTCPVVTCTCDNGSGNTARCSRTC